MMQQLECIYYRRIEIIARAIPVSFRIEIGSRTFGLAWRRDWRNR